MEMKAKHICLLTCMLLTHEMNIPSNNKNTKGSFVVQQGTKLDLSTFQSSSLTVGSSPVTIHYKILQQGSGMKPSKGQKVSVHYTGWLLNSDNTIGKKFDSSVDRGTQFSFPVQLGHVIAGWDHMVADMLVGEERVVVLPPAVAYGSRGAGAVIPANATLVFTIQRFA